ALRDEDLLHPISNGIDFLGYIVRPEYRLVRRRVVGNLHEKLLHWQRHNIVGSLAAGWCLRARPKAVSRLRAVLASYLGHFSHANHYRLLEAICLRRFPWLLVLFAFIVDHDKVKLLPLLAPHRVDGYRSQKRWFATHYGHAVSRVQRGVAMDIVRGGRVDRKRPECWLGSEQAGALLRSVTDVLVLENGCLKGGLKRREAVSLTFEPGTRLCASVPN
ncbi:MAG: hypothetical protein U9Q71_03460, partial [Pseudomonadota bacterium]|nr:hypothetical protein [Pseudomonadota bacterium]